jgi:exonuclease SbcD
VKVLGNGDLHWDMLSKRWAECVRIHEFIVELVTRVQPDLYACSGDIYERASLPQERLAVASWLSRIAEHCPVLIAKGNHDRKRDLQLLERLRTVYPIVVEEGASVHYIGKGAEKIAVAAIAWPDRAALLAYAHAQDTDAELTAHEALNQVFIALGHTLSEWKGPTMALGHLMVDGSVTSVGQPLIGQPMKVGVADLAALQTQFVLLGHIHKPQDWQHAGMQVVYSGSPFRTSYGETEDKSLVLIEFDGPKLKHWERIPTPCGAMHLVTEAWSYDADSETWGFAGGPEAHTPEDVTGAEIRLRYDVPADQRDAAAREASDWKARWLAAGALDVQVEDAVLTSTRARAPEVASALTLADKLLVLWKSKDTTPDSPRREHLLEMAERLQLEESA